MTTRTILFSSGEYSDYGLSGFLEIDSDAYQKAKSECEKLIEEEKAIKNFRQARKLAKGNLGILESPILKELLQKNQG